MGGYPKEDPGGRSPGGWRLGLGGGYPKEDPGGRSPGGLGGKGKKGEWLCHFKKYV